MSYSRDKKNIFITGASSGLGFEMTRLLVEQGHQVIACARNVQPLAELANNNKNIVAVEFDVSCASAVETVREQILQIVQQLDCVILNAGTCEYFDWHNPDWRMFDRVMSVNFFGVVHSMELVKPVLADDAHIVLISSLASFAPFTRSEAYGASKAAVDYFAQSLQMDLLNTTMDVTLVSPGFISTPMTKQNDFPMPFLMSAEKAAVLIINALNKRPKYFVFPKRFAVMLKLAYLFPSVWFRFVAPKLIKSQTLNSIEV